MKKMSVCETGVSEMGVGEMGQIIGETGVCEMGVGETGTNPVISHNFLSKAAPAYTSTLYPFIVFVQFSCGRHIHISLHENELDVPC